MSVGEIDILAEEPSGRLLIVEVRSRKNKKRRPSRFLSFAKVNRLKRMARLICAKYRKPVVIQLWELMEGEPMRQYWVE